MVFWNKIKDERGFTLQYLILIILIGAVLPLMEDAALPAFFLSLGFAALCLGLGFTHAIATLRAVVRMPATKRKAPKVKKREDSAVAPA